MICPADLASEVSAFQAARVGDHGGHVFLHAGRSGAGDESIGSDFAGASQEDQLVAGGRDHWDQRPADAALARALRREASDAALSSGDRIIGSSFPGRTSDDPITRCSGAGTKLTNNRVAGRCYADRALVSRMHLRKRNCREPISRSFYEQSKRWRIWGPNLRRTATSAKPLAS